MNKKIKVIELLNKIANGEEIPREIKVNSLDFIWNTFSIDDGEGYFNIKEGRWLEDYISLDSAEDLNTGVEILEDNTEEIEELDLKVQEGCVETEIYLTKRKINELVKTINAIRKDLNNDK